MYERNPHGAGIMFLKPDGNVHIEKGFFAGKDVLDYVHAHPELNDTDVVMHFRIATSGKRDGLGCHPYPVWSNNLKTSTDVSLAMCHNGILDSFGWKGTAEVNDTQVFIKECLRKLPHNFLRNKGIIDLLSKSTGTNRFAFLDKEGVHTIGNFIEDGGYLFSNTSYKSGKRLTSSELTSPVSIPKPIVVHEVKKAETGNLKEGSLAKLRLEGIDFGRKLTEPGYDKLSKWVIRFANYVKQTSGNHFVFEDSDYRYVFKSKQHCIERSLKFNLKELQDAMDRYFGGISGEKDFSAELYANLKEICGQLLRKDATFDNEDVESAYYDDDYYYTFNDEELSVSRFRFSEMCDCDYYDDDLFDMEEFKS